MLSLKRIPGGRNSEEYLLKKLQTDYRIKSERQSEWLGSGAARLGLSGPVERQPFGNLFRGLKPDGNGQLIDLSSIRKDYKHCAGTDQVFSVPKSVSIAWILFPEWKEPIENATWAAVRQTIQYEEATIAVARRGKGGARREPGQMIVGAVMEGYSRKGEPQLHVHAFTFDALGHSTGFGSFDTNQLFKRQIEMRQVFLARLALELQRAGLTTESTEGHTYEPGEFFRVAGIPEPLCKANSSRRAEILAVKAQRGPTTARQTDAIAEMTRGPKVEFSEDFVREKCQAVVKRLGYDLDGIRAAIRNPPPTEKEAVHAAGRSANTTADQGREETPHAKVHNLRPDATAPRAANNADPDANKHAANPETRQKTRGFQADPRPGAASRSANSSASDQSSKQESRIFAREDASVLELLVRAALNNKLPGPMIDRLIDGVLDQYDKRKLPPKAIDRGEEAQQAKDALGNALGSAGEMVGYKRHVINKDWIRSGISGTLTTRPADAAYVDVLSNTGAIACVEAGQGVDSKLLVAALVRKYPKEGFKVKAFTGTATAASELEQFIKTPTHTVSQLLYRLDPPKGDVLRHHAMQVLRAAIDKPTAQFERWKLDKNTVVVVTEAQTLRSSDLEKLLSKAESAGAKVVLIGDPSQLARREPHNAFSELAKHVGKISLPEPVRQTEKWVTEANRQVAQGDIRGGLSQYAVQDRLHIEKNQKSAAVAMVDHWKNLRRSEQDGKTLMIAGSDRDARVVNALAQQARRQDSGLGRFMWQRVDSTWVYRGDRVLFRIGSKHYGFNSGDLGTIERINLSSMTVKLDRTTGFLGIHRHIRVEVPKSLYRGLSLGYAVSAADSQGMSCERALVLPRAGGDDVRGLNAQLSRATTETHIFATPRTVGEDLSETAHNRRMQVQTAMKIEPASSTYQVEPLQEEQTRKQARGVRV